MHDTLCLCQFTFISLCTVSQRFSLFPKVSFSMAYISHVLSQRLCHCNIQSLYVVKTSVRILNTHSEIAILGKISFWIMWMATLEKKPEACSCKHRKYSNCFRNNEVRAVFFSTLCTRTESDHYIHPVPFQHRIFYYFTNNQVASFWAVWFLLNTVGLFQNEQYDIFLFLSTAK